MKCLNCERTARPRDLFCTTRCGHLYALELLATDDTRVCPKCHCAVGTTDAAAGQQRCLECDADVTDAPTAWERCFGSTK